MANVAAARPTDSTDSPSEKFAELRTLLVGPEQRQLRALQTRLDDPVEHARDVSRVLPAAVELRIHDPHLKRALAPTIEEAISASVRRNPRPLADALFPIFGPAIRKAIAATLSGMLESLNTTLEHSLSWRSLRWRLDARRTGKSFAEIVLLNTLVYRVEQVFLIHRPAGLLLQHLTLSGAPAQDADMVSGMLTAIGDFGKDSFQVADDEGLEAFKIGELSVWIEQGPHALLALVVRGTAPPALRGIMQQSLESVHSQYSDLLASFGGDASVFEDARPLLEPCFQQQYHARDRHRSRMVPMLATVLVLALAFWTFFALRARARWNGYIRALAAEPGIVVVSTHRENGKYVVSGLRDPLSRDPASLLAPAKLASDAVEARWQLYQALHPSLVLARARGLLAPPPGADLELENGVLSTTGAAPIEWIEASARIAPVLPGVTRFDPTRVVDAALKSLTASIEGAAPLFVTGTTVFTAGGEQIASDQIDRLRSLETLGRLGDRRFVVELIGHADADGAPEANLPLSRLRAERVRGMFEREQYRHVEFKAAGVGSRDAADADAPEGVKQRNRRVSFRVTRAAER